MSTVAQVIDGVIAENSSTTKAVNAGSNSSLDKDAFLQLLVAQMKYQDPLEPTSNTEYIAQYATFSQVESLQNMASSMESQNALTLVGKYVTVDVVSSSGAASTVSGRVDYVEKSGDETLLYIDGTPYNYENLNTVWDESYLEAYNLCGMWSSAVSELPKTEQITLDYEETITELRKEYNSMTPYQKSFIGNSLVGILKAAEERIEFLKSQQSEEV